MLLKESELDPRVKRTRQLLQDAFMELMQEKSFQSITVQDIASLATVNRATFYAHYEDKYDLLNQIIRDTFQRTLANCLASDAEFSLENLKILIVATCAILAHLYRQQCTPTTLQSKPLIEKEVQRQIFHIISGWLANLETANDSVQPELTASAISWAIFGAGLYWSQNNQDTSEEEVAEQVLALIMGGLENHN